MQTTRLSNLAPGWGEISLPEQKEYKFLFQLDTGEVFNFDPPLLISNKCVALMILTPVLTLARSIYWFAKAIFLSLAAAFNYLDGQDLKPEDKKTLVDSFKDSGRAWSYGLRMTAIAASGIFSPLDARLYYGRLEKELNRHIDGPHRDKLYLAICFQPLIIRKTDFSNSDQVKKKLIECIKKWEKINELFFTYSFLELFKEFNRPMRVA